MVFEEFGDDETIFKIVDPAVFTSKYKTRTGRLNGAYVINSHALRIIKTGLNCLKYRETDNEITRNDILKVLDLVTKEFDDLTE